jgi:hypothetical protein
MYSDRSNDATLMGRPSVAVKRVLRLYDGSDASAVLDLGGIVEEHDSPLAR